MPQAKKNPRLSRRYLSALAVIGIFGAFPFLFPGLKMREFKQFVYFAGANLTSIDDMLAKEDTLPWQDYTGRILNLQSIKPTEYWIKVPLPAASHDASTHVGEPMAIELSFPFFNLVDMYVVQDHRVVKAVASGAGHDLSQRDYFNFYHAIRFERGEHDQALFIRFRVIYAFQPAPLLFMNVADYDDFQHVRNFMLGLMVGGTLSIILYNFFVFLTLRTKAHLYYILYQTFALLTLINLAGPHLLFWSDLPRHPTWPGRLLYMTLAIALGMFAKFMTCLFTGEAQTTGISGKLQYVVYPVAALAIPMAMFMPLYSVHIAIFGLLVVVAPYFFIANMAKMRFDHIYYFYLAFAVLITGVMVPTLVGFQLLPPTLLTTQMYYLGCLAEAMMLSLALANQIRALQWERDAIVEAIGGEADHEKLGRLLGSALKPTQQVGEMNLTVMFVDVAKFSVLSDMIGTQQLLPHMSRQLARIQDIVMANHGVIDRSMGDGLLAVFGYQNSRGTEQHAMDAFSAAVQIQDFIVAGASKRSSGGNIVLPVRIGINTADVLVGNLGGRRRIDFTMIGDGVNFASRLEDAASPFMIVLSAATMAVLGPQLQSQVGFSEIFIKVKHAIDLCQAFEFNPFHDRQGALRDAEQLYLERLGAKRKEERLVVSRASPSFLVSAMGRFKIVNFSRRGFCAHSQVFVGQNADFFCSLESPDQGARDSVHTLLLDSFQVEVRWSRAVEDGYLHGLRLIGLNDTLCEHIYQIMRGAYLGLPLETSLSDPRGWLDEAK